MRDSKKIGTEMRTDMQEDSDVIEDGKIGLIETHSNERNAKYSKGP